MKNIISLKINKTNNNHGLEDNNFWCEVDFNLKNEEINYSLKKEVITFKELKRLLNSLDNYNIYNQHFNLSFIKNYFNFEFIPSDKDNKKVLVNLLNYDDKFNDYAIDLDNNNIKKLIQIIKETIL